MKSTNEVLGGGETKGLEPASAELLEQLLGAAHVLTADIEPTDEYGEGPYRIFKHSISNGPEITIYSPEANPGAVSIYYDWRHGDLLASRSITFSQAENGSMAAEQSWDYDDHLDRRILLGIYHRVKHLHGDLEAQFKSPINTSEAAADIELLHDIKEVVIDGLKTNDICRYVDPASGEEALLLIDRDQDFGGLKYHSFGEILTPLAEHEIGEAVDTKRADWIDIEATSSTGQRYMMHCDGYDPEVYAQDVEKVGRVEEDRESLSRRISERIHNQDFWLVDKQLFSHNSFGEIINRKHSELVGDKAELVRNRTGKADIRNDITAEDISIEVTRLAREVLAILPSQGDNFDTYDQALWHFQEAWDRYLAVNDLEAFVPLAEWLIDVEKSEIPTVGEQAKEKIGWAATRFCANLSQR